MAGLSSHTAHAVCSNCAYISFHACLHGLQFVPEQMQNQVAENFKKVQMHTSMSSHCSVHVQAELLQQEVINRQRLATAVQQLLLDLPKQAAAAEERMLMAEYVKGYQLVSLITCLLLLRGFVHPEPCTYNAYMYHRPAAAVCLCSGLRCWCRPS